jgi:RHS repeat-associated protein
VAVKRFAPDGVTPVDEIGFTYDAASRLTEETAAVHRVARRGAGPAGRWQWAALPEPRRTSIRHQRDALGNIAVTTLPHGPDVRYLRYGSGHLLQVNLGATVVAEMTRDDLHREVERSQGVLETRFGLDPMGRRLSCRTGLPEDRGADAPDAAGTGAPSGAMAKEYRYDAQGLLAWRRDGWQGARRFEYDLAGRIIAHTFGFGGHPGRRDEEFRWDGASNMLPLDRALRVISGETVQNRVMRWNGNVYIYDTHGRLTRKRTASGHEISFTWNSEHQLVQSRPDRGGTWTYHYDALGRRIAKERHGEDGSIAEATWFTWDGLRMVQEEPSPGQCITTVYEDAGSYVPLARAEHAAGERAVRPEQVFHFHTDVNGAPEEMTTHAGQTAWRARYQTWGNLALEEWSVDQGNSAQCRVQNLRFQGQYYDAETGLHYNTFRYYDPDAGRFISQDPIGLRGGLNLYQYAPDPVAWVDPWGWDQHQATMTVYDPEGNVRFSDDLRSGGATGTSWPEQIASHTESKGVLDPRIQPGDRVVFTDATLPPCYGCRGNMNDAAAAKNLNIEYHWNKDGAPQRPWKTNPEKAAKAIRNRNRRKSNAGCGET